MVVRERLSRRPPLNILFSRMPEWEEQIRAGFSHSRHRVVFREFATIREAIAAYDLVVPLTIDDLKYAARVRHLIADNPLPIPRLEAITLCDDKYRFNQFLQAHGFGDFVPQMGGCLGYPYIVKKRIDWFGQHSYIVADGTAEKACAALLADPEYFPQAFVSGPTEYATHIVVKDGRILCSVNIEYTFDTSSPIKGKANCVGECAVPCRHLDLVSAILDALEFEGLCCVNYKVAEDGRPMILEINPRFGGSLRSYFFGFVRYLRRQ